MADTKASAFTTSTTLTDDDTFPFIDDQDGTPGNRQITYANLKLQLSPAWSSYTPTWTTDGVGADPTIGNGTLSGAYVQIGKTVHFRISVTFGSTSTAGSGVYLWTLPVTPATFDSHYAIGQSYVEDAGTAGYAGFVRFFGAASTIGIIMHSSTTGAYPSQVTHAVPFSFANGDFIRIHGTYEAA